MQVVRLLRQRQPLTCQLLKRASSSIGRQTSTQWLPLTLTFVQAYQSHNEGGLRTTESHEYTIFMSHNIHCVLPTVIQHVLQRRRIEQGQYNAEKLIMPATQQMTRYATEFKNILKHTSNEPGYFSFITPVRNKLLSQVFISNKKIIQTLLAKKWMSAEYYFEQRPEPFLQHNNYLHTALRFSRTLNFYMKKQSNETIARTDSYSLNKTIQRFAQRMFSDKDYIANSGYSSNEHSPKTERGVHVVNQLLAYVNRSTTLDLSINKQQSTIAQPKTPFVGVTAMKIKAFDQYKRSAQPTPSEQRRVVNDIHEYNRKWIHLPERYVRTIKNTVATRTVHYSAPAQVIYRQQPELPAMQDTQITAQTAPDVAPKIDIARISRDVMHEIKKRQRVELERRGLL